MKKQEKIIDFWSSHICLYCGEEMKSHWDEYDKYYECDCQDAKLERELNDKIENLKRQLPKEKYSIQEVKVLRKNK